MLPAHQRFKAGKFACRQINDRLIKNFELALIERFAQIAFNLDTIIAIPAHGRFKDFNAVCAAAFGTIHRQLGFFQQVVVAQFWVVPDRNADRAGQNDFLAGERDRGAE